jgi:NAD(P)-dependent dehydrogenase (short-subunit alcohol dehydrogenase family)
MGPLEIVVIIVIFSIPFAVFAFVRYLQYKETIALAERGLLRTKRKRNNRNNAGITGRVGRLEDAPAQTLRDVMDLNVLGVMWCCQAAVRRMARRHGGSGGAIVNISSGAATLGSPDTFVWYAASKGAVDSLTVGLALENARDGLRVNAVSPGLVRTDIHADSGMPDRLETMPPQTPMGRAAEPEEIAEAVLWLLSDKASYTTGAILRVAGGR